MADTHYIRDADGNITHVRITSDDGRRSDLYEVDHSVAGQLFFKGKGRHVEVAEHDPKGTTRAYEPDDSILGQLLFKGKGKKK